MEQAPVLFKYRCGHCEYASNSVFDLEVHFKRIHKNLNNAIETINLPDICEEGMCHKCEKQFSSKYYLINNHLPKCEGKTNPLQCELCFKKFLHRYTKYQHKERCKIRIAKRMDEAEVRMLREMQNADKT
jgi:hypothetical protein